MIKYGFKDLISTDIEFPKRVQLQQSNYKESWKKSEIEKSQNLSSNWDIKKFIE